MLSKSNAHSPELQLRAIHILSSK